MCSEYQPKDNDKKTKTKTLPHPPTHQKLHRIFFSSGAISEAVLQDISAVPTDGDGTRIGGEAAADGADQLAAAEQLATAGLRQHQEREGGIKLPGSRLRKSDLHEEEAGAEREPAEHRRRVVATSERSDLQQEDASNPAQGKHRPNQPGGEVCDQNISKYSTYIKEINI